MSPEPTPTTREAVLLQPELCGELHPEQRSFDMELAPKRFGRRYSSGINSLHASKVLALLPTRILAESLCAASIHMPRSTFLWPAATSKWLSRQLPFYRGHDLRTLRVQVVAQNPFPGFWILRHKLLAPLLVLGVRMVLLECVSEAVYHFNVLLVGLCLRPASDLPVRSTHLRITPPPSF